MQKKRFLAAKAALLSVALATSTIPITSQAGIPVIDGGNLVHGPDAGATGGRDRFDQQPPSASPPAALLRSKDRAPPLVRQADWLQESGGDGRSGHWLAISLLTFTIWNSS